MPIARRAASLWMRITEPILLTQEGHRQTAHALRAARIGRFPEWYLAVSYLAAGFVALLAAPATWILLTITNTAPAAWRIAFGALAGVLGFGVMRILFLAYPRTRAAGRARRIDQELPAVVTLCYALARGGTNPVDVFRAVSAEKEAYGEISVEFAIVVRNVEWFGQDFVSALTEAAATTPSSALKGFFEGLVTILDSGAEAQDYFRHQAEAQLTQAELRLERDVEQASMLAEVYVSGLLVMPLMLLVVLAGLAPLAPGQDVLMPFVVFGMIPLGTAIYLVLLDTLLPSESLAVPRLASAGLVDFGMDTLPASKTLLPPAWRSGHDPRTAPMTERDIKAARSLRRRLALEHARMSISKLTRERVARLIAQPLLAAEFSAVIGVGLAAAVAAYAWYSGVRGTTLAIVTTGVLVLAAAITAIPISVFHEIRVRRARRIENGLPDALAKLAGFNEKGISLLQSFQILGSSASGPLATELRGVERDVRWNGSLVNALRRLRGRVSTLRMTKLGILLERASAATGNLREVLGIAANDASRNENLRATKRQAMVSYVVVIYIVFAVFVYVLSVVAGLFYGANGLGAATTGTSPNAAALRAEDAKLLFGQAAVIQGVGAGIVAGRLGEGHMLSGLKHAVILGVAAFLVFYFGVF